VRLARLDHEDVSRAEVHLLPGDLDDARATGDQVDLVHQFVAMGFVHPSVGPADCDG